MLRQLLDALERGLIVVALEAAGGCQRRAAEALGIRPSTLHQKLRRLGIPTARALQRVRRASREEDVREPPPRGFVAVPFLVPRSSTLSKVPHG